MQLHSLSLSFDKITIYLEGNYLFYIIKNPNQIIHAPNFKALKLSDHFHSAWL